VWGEQLGRSLTARIEGPLSEVGPLRAKGTVHAFLHLPFPCVRACFSFTREGGLFGLPLRATFSPAHPLARRDVPLARARAFRFSVLLFIKGVAKAALYCAHRATTVSSWGLCEQGGHLAALSSHLSDLALVCLSRVAWIGPSPRPSYYLTEFSPLLSFMEGHPWWSHCARRASTF
jgi:hypothetical protein